MRGNPSGSCTSPVTEECVCLGFRALPTVEQGVDITACCDGVERRKASWHAARLDFAEAAEARAEGSRWQEILQACGEGAGSGSVRMAEPGGAAAAQRQRLQCSEHSR